MGNSAFTTSRATAQMAHSDHRSKESCHVPLPAVGKLYHCNYEVSGHTWRTTSQGLCIRFQKMGKYGVVLGSFEVTQESSRP
jgi:hypothetical protein